MKGYRVVFVKKGLAELHSYEVAPLKNDEVLVKVDYTLISAGTEKATLAGAPNTAGRFPAIPGYSSVGHVISTGKDAVRFKEGDSVFVEYGGHASYNCKKETAILPIPDGVDPLDAVFTKLASFPLLGLRRARLEIGESVVVVGLGMLGLFGVQIARACGAFPLIAVGNREIRQEKARQFQADMVLSPDDPELVPKIMKMTKDYNLISGANIVLETSGSMSGLNTALKYTAKQGRVILTGCNRVCTDPIDLYQHIHRKGVSLIGAHGSTHPAYHSFPGNFTARRDYSILLGLIREGRIRPREIFSETVQPDHASEVYERLLNDREFPLGVVFDWTQY